jgi:hypothetical protein
MAKVIEPTNTISSVIASMVVRLSIAHEEGPNSLKGLLINSRFKVQGAGGKGKAIWGKEQRFRVKGRAIISSHNCLQNPHNQLFRSDALSHFCHERRHNSL